MTTDRPSADVPNGPPKRVRSRRGPSRRETLAAAAVAAVGTLAARDAAVEAATIECDDVHPRIQPRDITPWAVDLPTPKSAKKRRLFGSGGHAPNPPIGHVEQGVAPEWFWFHKRMQMPDGQAAPTHGPPQFNAKHGEATPGRPDDVFIKDSPSFDAQFINMETREFAGCIVPGYLTPMLGYAAEDPDEPDPAKRFAHTSPGPLIEADLGEPILMRVRNNIDPRLHLEVSVHLHGGHTPAHADGHADFLVPPGEARDYFYPNAIPKHVVHAGQPLPGQGHRWRPEPKVHEGGRVEVFEEDEALSTAWYHDHAEGITANNALKGLAGMYIVRDDHEKALIREGFLPPADFERAIAIRDVCLEKITDRARMSDVVLAELAKRERGPKVGQCPPAEPFKGEARIHFDAFDHDGTLGNLILLNGVPQPRWIAKAGVWRLRLLNASLARFYEMQFIAVHRTTGRTRPLRFARIGKDSWLLPTPIPADSIFLGMANRADVLLDLRGIRPGITAKGDPDPDGEDVYLINTLDQRDGRGPGHGDNELGNLGFTRGQQFSPPRVRRGTEPRLMRIIVRQNPDLPAVATAPRFSGASATTTPTTSTGPTAPAGPTTTAPAEQIAPIDQTLRGRPKLRPITLIPFHEGVPTRVFEFDRGQGAWQINGRFYEPRIANAVPSLWSTERWILRNKSGGWWHPIHIHLEAHQHLAAVARNNAGQRIVVKRHGYDLRDEHDELITHAIPPEEAEAAEARGGEPVPFDTSAEFDQTVWHPGIRHDTTVLGPNTEVHVIMRFRTFQGPFVFHCHNLNHEDMMMMFQFDPRADAPSAGVSLPATDAAVRPAHWFFREPRNGGRS